MQVSSEYLESDQAQPRKPLFEMIKELVTGDGPSRKKCMGIVQN